MKHLLRGVLGLIAGVALVQPGLAAAIHNLDLTENSDTSLTVTFDGGALSVTNAGTDHWFVSLPAFLSISGTWFEPGSTTSFNTINGSGTTLEVLSDQSLDPLAAPNDTQITGAGTDITDGESVNAVFNDVTDVPEPASLALLGTALAGLGLIRRRKRNV